MAAVMTPFPFSADAGDSLRHLPVVKNDGLLGILTDRDLKRALDPDLRLPPMHELFVRDVYLPDPYVVDDRSPLDDVLEHMATYHLGSALVTKHGRLAGIFTSTDACRAYCEHLRRIFPRPVGTDAA